MPAKILKPRLYLGVNPFHANMFPINDYIECSLQNASDKGTTAICLLITQPKSELHSCIKETGVINSHKKSEKEDWPSFSPYIRSLIRTW